MTISHKNYINLIWSAKFAYKLINYYFDQIWVVSKQSKWICQILVKITTFTEVLQKTDVFEILLPPLCSFQFSALKTCQKVYGLSNKAYFELTITIRTCRFWGVNIREANTCMLPLEHIHRTSLRWQRSSRIFWSSVSLSSSANSAMTFCKNVNTNITKNF